MISLASYLPHRSLCARAFWMADGTANSESGVRVLRVKSRSDVSIRPWNREHVHASMNGLIESLAKM